MVVARFDHGQLTVIDRLREMVRLASGLNRESRLSEASQARALATLRRFGERLRDMQAGRVRVVGTNTLRRAKSTGRFLQRAAKALGHPVEIISGIEEARLIYLGASHNLPRVDGPQIVVDIGGGSTEIIAGRGLEPATMESLHMGCVSLSEGCFPGGRLSAKNFEKARLQVRLELEPVRSQFRKVEPAQVAGTSGSIRAAHAVLTALDRAPQGVTVEGLEYLIEEMISAGRIADLRLPELSADRAEVFPGGVAILVEVMRALGLGRMIVADGALREGILYDMIGRLTDEDARVRTVRAMAARYHVDRPQAERVEATAMNLYAQAREDWDLDDDQKLLLAWAARIARAGPRYRPLRITTGTAPMCWRTPTCRASRARSSRCWPASCWPTGASSIAAPSAACRCRGSGRRCAWRSCCASPRSFTAAGPAGTTPDLKLRVQGRTLRLQVPAAWLESNPLTLADLERERDYLDEADYKLIIQRRTARRSAFGLRTRSTGIAP